MPSLCDNIFIKGRTYSDLNNRKKKEVHKIFEISDKENRSVLFVFRKIIVELDKETVGLGKPQDNISIILSNYNSIEFKQI